MCSGSHLVFNCEKNSCVSNYVNQLLHARLAGNMCRSYIHSRFSKRTYLATLFSFCEEFSFSFQSFCFNQFNFVKKKHPLQTEPGRKSIFHNTYFNFFSVIIIIIITASLIQGSTCLTTDHEVAGSIPGTSANYKCGLGLERGSPSLVRTIGQLLIEKQ